jgi:hypothetical protein
MPCVVSELPIPAFEQQQTAFALDVTTAVKGIIANTRFKESARCLLNVIHIPCSCLTYTFLLPTTAQQFSLLLHVSATTAVSS